MSDETPVAPSPVPQAETETFVISQIAIAGKVFEHLIPNEQRPGSWVTLRRVSDARKRQINDKCKVSFGDKPMNVKFGNAFEQTQLESFVEMGGWNIAPGQPLPSTAENFVEYVASHQFVYEGAPTTVWTRCEAMIDEQLYGATKNS